MLGLFVLKTFALQTTQPKVKFSLHNTKTFSAFSFPSIFSENPFKIVPLNKGGNAENVLVLCNENFTFGWVVCKANVFSTNNPSIDYSIETQNFGYDETKKRIEHTNFDQIIPDSDYENLVIQTLVFEDKNDSNKQGGLCEFYNYRTGDKFILHSSGNGMAITATGIKLFTGDQVNVSELKDGKCSSIMIRPDEITFTAQKVEFNAIHIGLGKGCRKVVTTTQSQPTYAEGSPFLPIGKTRGGSDLTNELTVEA